MPGPKLYRPYDQQFVDPARKITREWFLADQQMSDVLFSAGDVFGPPAGVGSAGDIAIFADTTGKQLADGGFTILQVIQEARKTFAHTFLLMGG